jgi:hypothetical protein
MSVPAAPYLPTRFLREWTLTPACARAIKGKPTLPTGGPRCHPCRSRLLRPRVSLPHFHQVTKGRSSTSSCMPSLLQVAWLAAPRCFLRLPRLSATDLPFRWERPFLGPQACTQQPA